MQRDPRFQRFEVLPLTGALGAEVRGVRLSGDADDEIFAELRRVLDQLSRARGARPEPDAADATARSRAASGRSAAIRCTQPIEGFDDIVRFVREPDDTGKVIGENWHMDLAWMAKPPGITMLYGEVIPPVGGDTCFASLEQAYRALSPRHEGAARRADRDPQRQGRVRDQRRARRASASARTTRRRSRSSRPSIR